MGKPRVAISAAYIGGGFVLLAALIGVFGNSCLLKQARPRLNIELEPSPNEYLKKDGNSQLYLDSLYNNIFIVLPFKIRNIDKTHAVKISALYSSPSQRNVPIELGEKSSFLSSGEEIPETFRPHINISTIINDAGNKEFKIELVLDYKSDNNKDQHSYNTKLELILVKEKTEESLVVYKIKDSNLLFGVNKE